MARACARHILVKTKEEAERLKKQLAGGADFATLAKNTHNVTQQKKEAILLNLAPVRC